MVKIYVQTTHLKVFYEDATIEEKNTSEKILSTKFIAEDKKLRRDPRVIRKLMSPYVNFYIKQHNILPVGLLPYLLIYYDRAELEYEIKDLRKFPKVNKEFIKKLINNEIIIKGKDGKEYIPRDYQRESVLEIVKSKGGIIQLPTGSGKGMIAGLFCHVYRKSRILFIFDSIDLINDTRSALINKYGINEKEVGVIQGQNFQGNKRITLLSMQSYEKAMHIFPQVKVVIADECHTTGRSGVAERIIYSCQNAPIRIGLSATANCLENPLDQMKLYANIGPIIYEKEIVEQINNGVLSPLDVMMYEVISPTEIRTTGKWTDVYDRTQITKKAIKETIKHLSKERGEECTESEALYYIIDSWIKDKNGNPIKGRDYVFEKGKYFIRQFVDFGDESTHYVFNNYRNKLIADLANEYKRVLIIFSRIEHGKELKKLLPKAVLIHGKDNLATRKEAEQYLKSKKSAIVLSSKIWKKGKDIPEIETFINVSGGVSQIEQIQKMGRATRNSPESGKERALIIDFYDTFSPLGIKQSNKRKRTYERLNLKPQMVRR